MKIVQLTMELKRLTGSEELPKDIFTARTEGTRKARNVAKGYYPDGCYKAHLPKCIHPCESRGTTNEASVMEVEEQPRVFQ